MLLEVFGTEEALDEIGDASYWPDWTPGGDRQCSCVAIFGQIILLHRTVPDP
jgi:hypothetical protein